MAAIAGFVGALIGVWIISRVLRATVFRALSGYSRLAAVYVSTLLLGTVLGGLGFADGGPPQFGYAFLSYLPPVLVWAGYDYLRLRKSGRAPA
jgi:hypothetical protein